MHGFTVLPPPVSGDVGIMKTYALNAAVLLGAIVLVSCTTRTAQTRGKVETDALLHPWPFNVTHTTSPDRQRVHFPIRAEDFRAYPVLSSLARLPLSPPRAVRLAEADLPQYVREPSDWYVSGVELLRVRQTDKWYFVVCFEKKPRYVESPYSGVAQVGEFGTHLGIPVLFTGRTIRGNRDGDSNKRPAGNAGR